MSHSPNSISEIERFLGRYREFESSWWQVRKNEDFEAFTSLINQYRVFRSKTADIKKKEVPFFNIFDILNIRHLEEVLHTPMLCHFLDPKGTHEHQDLFLHLFFEKVLGVNVDMTNISNVLVDEEFSTPHGRIDIFLRYNLNGKKHVLIIENKIYAGDQKEQLKRYYLFAKDFMELPDEQIQIIYLKPRVGEPSHYSIDKELFELLRSKNVLHLKGYREDIYPWLVACYDKVESPSIKAIIKQYSRIIKSL